MPSKSHYQVSEETAWFSSYKKVHSLNLLGEEVPPVGFSQFFGSWSECLTELKFDSRKAKICSFVVRIGSNLKINAWFSAKIFYQRPGIFFKAYSYEMPDKIAWGGVLFHTYFILIHQTHFINLCSCTFRVYTTYFHRLKSRVLCEGMIYNSSCWNKWSSVKKCLIGSPKKLVLFLSTCLLSRFFQMMRFCYPKMMFLFFASNYRKTLFCANVYR